MCLISCNIPWMVDWEIRASRAEELLRGCLTHFKRNGVGWIMAAHSCSDRWRKLSITGSSTKHASRCNYLHQAGGYVPLLIMNVGKPGNGGWLDVGTFRVAEKQTYDSEMLRGPLDFHDFGVPLSFYGRVPTNYSMRSRMRTPSLDLAGIGSWLIRRVNFDGTQRLAGRPQRCWISHRSMVELVAKLEHAQAIVTSQSLHASYVWHASLGGSRSEI